MPRIEVTNHGPLIERTNYWDSELAHTGKHQPEDYAGCICPLDCDCQNPEPDGEAIAYCSQNCPIHNLYPEPVPECPATRHVNGAVDPTTARLDMPRLRVLRVRMQA